MPMVHITRTERGTILFDNGGLTPLPTSLALEIAKDCFVEKIEIYNKSGADRTVEAWAGNGDDLIPPTLLHDGQVLFYVGNCRRTTGGIQWKADGAGCKGTIAGFCFL
jgi:hypothetical protein